MQKTGGAGKLRGCGETVFLRFAAEENGKGFFKGRALCTGVRERIWEKAIQKGFSQALLAVLFAGIERVVLSPCCRMGRDGFPACGARKNLRAVRLLGFFDHCALSRSASSPTGRAARVFPLAVPKADGRSCSSLSALTAALSVSPLFPPLAARRYFVRLRYPKKPLRCSLARFFRPLRSQSFGFIARRARRTASFF